MITKIVSRIFSFAGLLKLMRWYYRDKIIIISLHSVVDFAKLTWQPLRRPFSIDLLRRQLAIIDRHYHWLSLDDAVEMLAGRKPFVPNGIVLTFDDGYRNNMTVALPELEKYSIKPAFYVATAMLNSRKPYWFERLDYAIQHLKQPTMVELRGQTFRFLPNDREGQRATYAELRQAAKRQFDSDHDFYQFFDTTTDELEKSSGLSLAQIQTGDPCSETLSDGDLRTLEGSGRATIGSHTVDHIRLDTVDEKEYVRQLTESKERIEAITGTPCRHFCYPNGNWNRAVASGVAAAGYTTAVTGEHGMNGIGADLHSLKRMHMPDISDEHQLLFYLAGFGEIRGRIEELFGSRQPG